jgi:hypothetical protein
MIPVPPHISIKIGIDKSKAGRRLSSQSFNSKPCFFSIYAKKTGKIKSIDSSTDSPVIIVNKIVLFFQISFQPIETLSFF